MNELHDIHVHEKRKMLYWQTIIVGAVVCLLFALSKITESSTYIYIGAFVAIASCLFFDVQDIGVFIAFICSNTYFIMMGDNALCGYLVLIACIVRAMELFKKISEDLFVACIFLLTSSCISAVLFDNWALCKGMIKSIAFILFFVSIVREGKKELVLYLSKAYIIGAVFGALLGLVYYWQAGKNLLPDYALGIRFSGLSKDPNYFSASLLFSLALISFLSIYENKLTIINVIYAVILSLVGLLTLSRGFLLGFILLAAFLFVYIFFTKRISSQMKLMILFGTLIVVLITFKLWWPIMELFIERIKAPETSGGSGRIQLYMQYLKATFSSPLNFIFGGEVTQFKVSSHNTFIDILHQMGFVGVTAYSLLIWVIFKLEHKTKGCWMVAVLPFLAMSCSYFFLTALNGDNFIFSLILGVQIFALFDKSKEMESEIKNGNMQNEKRN